MKIFWYQIIFIFWSFSDIFKFNSQFKILVLTKCWLKYYRSIRNLLLMFFISWINIVSPKLKKYLMAQTPPPKKMVIFWGGGGSGALKYKDLGYVSSRMGIPSLAYSRVDFHNFFFEGNIAFTKNTDWNPKFIFYNFGDTVLF